MTASAEARDTALLAAQAAADKLATDVSIVDVSDRLAITDAFVLASAPNERQVQAIVDEVEERLREHGIKPVRREGVAESRWVLLDFVDVVVHVQHAEERAYYALERLWKDCPTIPFVDSARRAAAAAGRPGDGAAPADGRRPAGDRRARRPRCPCRGWSSGGTAAPSGTSTGRFQGQLDPPLDEAGRRQAAAAAPHARRRAAPARTRSSCPATSTGPPRPRRRSPALLGRPAARRRRGCASTAWARWEGLTRAEVADAVPRPVRRLDGRAAGARAAAARSPAAVGERALAALADLPAAAVAVVVTHGGTAGRLIERAARPRARPPPGLRAAGQLRLERAGRSRATAGGCCGTTSPCSASPAGASRASGRRRRPTPAPRRTAAPLRRRRRRRASDEPPPAPAACALPPISRRARASLAGCPSPSSPIRRPTSPPS